MKVNVLLFTQTLHSLLKSGLTLQDCILVCRDIFSTKEDRLFIEKLYSSIRDGKLLSEALMDYEREFSSFYISFVRIGEESGQLCEVFEKLSDYLKSKKEMKEKFFQSLAYPILVLVTAFFVVLIMTFFVFPRLEGIFEAFGENSQIIGSKINGIRRVCKVTGFSMIFILMLILSVFVLYGKSMIFRALMDRIFIKLPFVSRLIVFNQTLDFSFSMKLLSSAYYPLTKSLRLCADSASNICYRDAIKSVCEKVTRGEEAGKSFSEEKIFPLYFVTWVKLSERDGNVLNAFSQIYEYFRNENERFLSRAGAMAEPVFILITGIVIFIVIAQFVLPVFSLLGEL